mmetsp:Transcript_6840/g.10044  ORF Transcript_6840/g.10044 Transcript_6840/m.10044 type:complete len:264 (-) Transcript_6840:564-1355(-)
MNIRSTFANLQKLLLSFIVWSVSRTDAATFLSNHHTCANFHVRTQAANAFACPMVGRQQVDSRLLSKPQKVDTANSETSPVAKASWYAVEVFGQIFGSGNRKRSAGETSDVATDAIDLSVSPKSLDEALKRIEMDNARSYFLSGEVDVEAYAEECIFADPFVSFSGRTRFVDNLANLGSFITNYDAKFLGYEVDQAGVKVQTKVMVKLELNLPWKPVLAWPWGVAYSIDPDSFLITEHVESWDIEPLEGVKQIFRKPTVKISK